MQWRDIHSLLFGFLSFRAFNDTHNWKMLCWNSFRTWDEWAEYQIYTLPVVSYIDVQYMAGLFKGKTSDVA